MNCLFVEICVVWQASYPESDYADIKSRSWLDWTYLRDGRESSKIRDQSERSFTRENQSHA